MRRAGVGANLNDLCNGKYRGNSAYKSIRMCQAKVPRGPLPTVSVCFPADFPHSSGTYFCLSTSFLIALVMTQTRVSAVFPA